ncbi:hypothetical protein [Paenibacillus larvae]|uniref:hypothetical protein n=1 Tax=Paenibacillus larvae TaxID=1464 RepID=UPI00288E50AE|nr:hypothetical protein [Paenibacillus larvae]MDT2193414.1 hypothetical protein [Paenibacillus larvae]
MRFIIMDDRYGNQWIAEWHLDARFNKRRVAGRVQKIPRGGSEETKAGEPELRLEKDLAIVEITRGAGGKCGIHLLKVSTVAS